MQRLSSTSYYGWIVLICCLWLLYVVSPIDLLPDVFPGIGWADDLVSLAGVYWFIRRLQAYGSMHASQDNFRTSSQDSRTSTGGNAREEDLDDATHTGPPEHPCDVLGVKPDASAEQIRAAYTQLMLKYHPDRVAHLGEEFQRLAHRKTLAITDAYNTLKQQKTS
jgi:DnaJ like chaperone protein